MKAKIYKRFCGYPLDLVIISCGHKKIRKLFPGAKKSWSGFATIDQYKGEERLIIIFNSKYKFNSWTVAHECFHAQSLLFEWISEEGKCEEPRAYFLERAHKKCCKLLGI